MNNILVIGAGGHSKVIIDTLIFKGDDIVAIFDDDNQKIGSDLMGITIKGPISRITDFYSQGSLVIGIGNNDLRKRFFMMYQDKYNIVNVIHPNTYISKNVKMGTGIVVFSGVTINTDTIIGNGCIINTCSSIDHDNRIGDFTHIMPGARLAGGVEVGSLSEIGIGSSVIQDIKIGHNVSIGAGAAVVNNVPNDVISVGVPAKIIKYKSRDMQ
jgi:sugar O-acyltransferase (sialic acid O-acetyltransferase NeuD family)